MSWQATAYVAEITEGITPNEKLVLLCLANRYNNDRGFAWPSIPRLAGESLMSERTVYRVLKSLASKGFIAAYSGGGRGMTNQYVINFHRNPDTVSPFSENPDSGAQNPDSSGINPDSAGTETLTGEVGNPDTAVSPKQEEPQLENRNENRQTTGDAGEAFDVEGHVQEWLDVTGHLPPADSPSQQRYFEEIQARLKKRKPSSVPAASR